MANLVEREPQGEGNQKSKRIVKFAIGFFVLMAVLTFFSNTINNLSLPRVKTGQPQNGQIVKEFKAEGSIVALSEKSISTASKGAIVKLNVKVGDIVKVDDILMELEDKDKGEEADASYEAARHALELRKKALEEKLKPATTPTPDPYKEAIEQKRKEAAYQKLVEAYWEALQKFGENTDPDQAKTLSDAVKAAAEALQAATEDREIEAREALRKQQEEAEKEKEAARKLADEVAEERYQIRLDEEKLAKMRADMADSGLVKATYGGVIRKLNVEEGQTLVGGEVVAVVHDLGKGYEFRASVTLEESKRVKAGDAVEIALTNGLYRSGKVREFEDAKEGSGKEMIVDIENQEQLKGGESASITITNRSRNYDFLVPVGAVYSDNDGKYILTMQEKSGPLGNQYTVTRVPVTVFDQDNFRAALSISSGWVQNIVVSSDKPIADGARVMPAR